MRKRRKPFARTLAAGLALTLALPAAVARAAPQGDFEQLIAQADGHADAQRHADALQTYVAAFDAMPDELKGSEVGEFVALAAAKAAKADYQEREDEQALAQGRGVLTRFIEQASGVQGAPSVEPAKERLAELDALVPPERPEPVEVAPPEPAPEEVEPAAEEVEPVDRRSVRRRKVALGLIIGGGVAAVAGLSLTLVGTRQVPWYEQQLAQGGWTPETMGYAEQIQSAERIRDIDIGVGIALIVVGVGVGVGGGVLLAKNRRGADSRASVVPSLRRDGVGLTLRLAY